MEPAPIIFAVSEVKRAAGGLEEALRGRYVEGYRVVVTPADADPVRLLRLLREQEAQIALLLYEGASGAAFLSEGGTIYAEAGKLLLDDVETLPANAPECALVRSWNPPEIHLYPVLDELLAEWRASVNRSISRVRGIMTLRTVRVRIGDSLHRAAEVIALSGVGDLMVIDDDNNFVGVLSVGDVLRAAMPDFEEITGAGGTLEQAFRLFLRKGSELMYKPIQPLVITQPLVLDPDDHVAKAAALMLEKNIHRLPVVKDGRLVGTVGRTDICQAVVGTL
jgi:CBS domain-containing protein